jgi:phosphohistidine phosphatase
MKKIIILRHGEASNGKPDGTDKSRELTAAGKDYIRSVGEFLKLKQIKSDYILCSDAVRAQQTLENFLEGYGRDISNDLYSEIYSGSIDDIVTVAFAALENQDSIMIIGHNPVLENLAYDLTGSDCGRLRPGQGYVLEVEQLPDNYLQGTFDLKLNF